MYVSRAVREIRNDPIPGEAVTLLLRLADEAVREVCELDGLRAVETDNVLAMDLDGAGEDAY